jgi:hypothetical protein
LEVARGGSSEEDLRVSLAGHLGLEEQRGCVIPSLDKGKGSGLSSESEVKDQGRGMSKRSRKNWMKAKKAGFNYVVGEDVSWDNVLRMSTRTLVGRAMGRNFAIKTVIDWAYLNWRESLGYVLEVVTLTWGWFAFKFLKEEQLLWVLNRNWALEHTPLLLKPWYPPFDASRERVDTIPLWVRLPGLLLHFWDLVHF